MFRKPLLTALCLALALSATSLWSAGRDGFSLALMVDDVQRPEFVSGGTVYVEALKGREYSLRITNPLPYRVAVALSVDGLNTINAKRSSVRNAPKWVLGPYETVTISGWQINGSEARKFYFTGEKQSYGAWLGQTDNLGVIEAAFFREKVPPPPPPRPIDIYPGYGGMKDSSAGSGRLEAPRSQNAPSPAPSQKGESSAESKSKSSADLSDDYAATGIGRKEDHGVEWVHLELERNPSAVVRIRYEFRPQLVRLGVLPEPRPTPDPLERREHARGFSGGYCPDPYGGSH